MFDSTAEREAWEAEVRGVVDAAIDERVSKQYSFYNVNPDDLVTGRQLEGVLGSVSYAHERITAIEMWRNTRWHVKAGRALKATWNGFFLPLIVASVVVFMLYCTLTVVIGWLS
jgi:hypothetical protein